MSTARTPQVHLRGLASALFVTLLVAASPSLAEAPLGCPLDFERQVLVHVNQIRLAAGLDPLAMDVRLMESAQLHSEDLALNGLSGHIGSNGSTFDQRIEAAGYTEWQSIAENVAGGFTTPGGVVDAWMDSPLHRANILNESVEHIGIGYAFVPGTQYWHYWTQNFGALQAGERLAPETECPECSNGVDDDYDGLIDAENDLQCQSHWDDSEMRSQDLACGLGFEAALALLPLMALRRRRRS